MLLDKQSGRSQTNAWLFLEREGKKSQLLIRGGWCGLVRALQLSRGAALGCRGCVQGGLGCREQMVHVGHPGQSRQGTEADWRWAEISQCSGGDGELGRQRWVLPIRP